MAGVVLRLLMEAFFMGENKAGAALSMVGKLAGVALLLLVLLKAWSWWEFSRELRQMRAAQDGGSVAAVEKKPAAAEKSGANEPVAACLCSAALYCIGEMGGVYCLRRDGKKKYVKEGGAM